MAAVHLEHIAAGCNRAVHALDWGPTGLLAFTAHNNVMVYEPEEARVLGTLLGHTDRANCVRWLPPDAACAPAAALASGGGDGTVRVWVWSPATPGQPWRLAATLQGHAAPVTSLAALSLGGGAQLLVSTAGDGEVCVWQSAAAADGPETPTAAAAAGEPAAAAAAAAAEPCSGGWSLRQRIQMGQQVQDCAALAALPAAPGWLLLALGGVDAGVRLYVAPPGGDFALACKLGGHLDWVKGLAFAELDGGKLLLASSSQDRTVRVWAVTHQQQHGSSSAAGNGSSVAAAPDMSALAASLTRYAPKPLIHAGGQAYAATLEAVLVGHEDWVHSVAWHPSVAAGGSSVGASAGARPPPCLLSASMDRTMMLWRPDAATGLWMSEESVGDAGANHLGYYTCSWAPDGAAIAAHGFTGALHIWRRCGEDGAWLPQHALGGHYGPVVDACWAADGACLLTVSCDQTARLTTRLAAPPGEPAPAGGRRGHWCEVARPQVHGHDFAAVAALPAPAPGRHLYASASEEKVVRVFEAPRAFQDTLAMARGQAVAPAAASGDASGAAALGAMLPALGLSNKAVYDESEGGAGAGADASSLAGGLGAAGGYGEGPDLAPCPAPSAVAGPPMEEHLAQNTLWPETHKLYGHGNDVYCLAADPRGAYIASACRAQSADTAAIWLWDTARWTGVAQLAAHTLTVTQLAFSPDGRYLASASRDRSVALFERQEGSEGAAAAGGAAPPFRLVGRLKAHARIVWGLHWSPDSRLLATASRDGKVKVWSLAPGSSELPAAPAAIIDCGDSVRSVQFAPACTPGAAYHLAAGLEGGALQLLRLAAAPAGGAGGGGADGGAGGGGADGGSQPQLAITGHELVWQSPEWERHAAAVRRLCWRVDEEAGPGCCHLASVSEDHALRVFAVRL